MKAKHFQLHNKKYYKCDNCSTWDYKDNMINGVCSDCFNELDKNGCFGSVED